MFQPANLGKRVDGLDYKSMYSVFLEKREFTEINEAVIEVAEEPFSLIDGAFPTITMKDPNKKKYEYTTLTETGDAGILQKPSDFPALTVNGTLATVDIPWKGLGFDLEKEDIANSKRLGESLDTLHARIAAKKVRKLQDEALYSKSSAFGTLGVEDQATGSFSGTNWSTTTTNIYDQVRQWILAIPAAYSQEKMTMLLHRDQYGELFRDSWDNGTAIIQVTGGSFWAKIKQAFPELDIRQTQWATSGEGILYPFNEDVVTRVNGLEARAIDWDENPVSVQMVVFAKDVLVVPTPSAVVKATTI